MIDPAELSACLDGELPPARAREVEALLAADPALRTEYEALREMDAGWREAGATAMFVPHAALPSDAPQISLRWAAAVILLLLGARLGGKFIGALGPSLFLNLVALLLVGWAVAAAARMSRGQTLRP